MADRLEVVCDRCGSKKFKLPDNPGPNDTVTCAGCGATTTYGKLQDQAIAEAKKAVDNMFANAFKNWKQR